MRQHGPCQNTPTRPFRWASQISPSYWLEMGTNFQRFTNTEGLIPARGLTGICNMNDPVGLRFEQLADPSSQISGVAGDAYLIFDHWNDLVAQGTVTNEANEVATAPAEEPLHAQPSDPDLPRGRVVLPMPCFPRSVDGIIGLPLRAAIHRH